MITTSYLTPKIESTLKPRNYDAKPWRFHFTEQKMYVPTPFWRVRPWILCTHACLMCPWRALYELLCYVFLFAGNVGFLTDPNIYSKKTNILLYSVSVPWIIYCKYWIWMRPPAPAGGPRLVCPPAQSGCLASVLHTLRGVSACKLSEFSSLWILLPGGWDGLTNFVTDSAH